MNDKENKLNSDENAQAEQKNQAVKYEKNDNWQFDASAPTLEDNLAIGNDYEIDVAQAPVHPKKKAKDKNREADKEHIVINKRKLKVVSLSIVSVILAALIVFFGIKLFALPNTSETMTPGNVALTVGKTKVSVGMYNFYYSRIVANYLEYASNGSFNLDSTKDYAEQKTVDKDGNEISWLDVFERDTIEQIQYIVAYYETALEAGLTLTDDQKSNIESEIETIKSSASDAGVSVDKYLETNYGDYCGLETVKKIYEQSYIAENYFYQQKINLSANEEEINKTFEENKDNYTSISYGYIEMQYNLEDPQTSTVDAVKAKAQTYCDRISTIDDMKNLVPEICSSLIEQVISYGYFSDTESAVKALQDSVSATSTATELSNNFGSGISDWFFSPDTSVGSTTCLLNEEYSSVLIFLKSEEPKLDETEYYSVRHILVVPGEKSDDEGTNASETKEYTEEEWNAALDEANKILDEYNSGDKTEASFALLAEKYSEDTESTSSGSSGYYGGGYSQVALGYMVPEFESWATDDARKYGDVEIVKSQFGYHIMYFVYDGPKYLYNAMSDANNAKEDEFLATYEVKKHSALKKTTVAEPTTVTTTQAAK